MGLSTPRILNNELLNKCQDVVPEQEPLIIFDGKSAVYMDKNGKYTKHIRHIYRIMHFLINGDYWNMNKTVWCDVGLKLKNIGIKNVRENELNPLLEYYMVRINNWQKICTRGLIE